LESPFCISSTAIHYESPMTFSIVIMVGRGYFLPTHVHEASYFFNKYYRTVNITIVTSSLSRRYYYLDTIRGDPSVIGYRKGEGYEKSG
jgi:hypothetical protein